MIWMSRCGGLRRAELTGQDASGGSLIGRRKSALSSEGHGLEALVVVET